MSELTTDSNALYNDIIQKVENELGEPLYPGDERRIFIEAIAYVLNIYNALAKDSMYQHTLQGARGENLDALVEFRGLERRAPQKATVTMLFWKTGENEVFVPKGTKVTGDFEHIFQTDKDLTIIDPSDTVTATAIEGGADYNGATEGSINTLIDMIADISSVENTTVSSGGADEEDDESLRERYRQSSGAYSVAGPINAYRYFTMQADSRIKDVLVEKDEGTPGSNPGALVITVLADESVDINAVAAYVNDSERRPLTDKVRFTKVGYYTAPDSALSMTYEVPKSDELEVVKRIEGPGGAIDQWSEWQSSKMNRAINHSKLIGLCMQAGATKVSVSNPKESSNMYRTAYKVDRSASGYSVTHRAVNE